jgi:tetratricopeptide (TPR) repeat protein
MKRYKDGLVPRDIKKGFYRNIELGKDVVLQRIEIGNQIREMITSHIGLSGTSNTNREAINASINLLSYDDRDIGNGMYGMKASFEWNISEVVWQIEQNVEEFKDMIKIIYDSQEPSFSELRSLAQEDYENGRIADAINNFSKLAQCCENDFSVFLSLGIINLFHEKDKEKALENFNKAVEIVESQSDFYTSYALLYKALVLCNLDRIGEAEIFSRQAVDLSPDFTEALYQNAQYNALLKHTDTAISSLKTIVCIDILYCLKITNERDFDGIRPHITKILKEACVSVDEGIKKKLKKFDEKLHHLNAIVSSLNKQGLNISDNQDTKQLQDDKQELVDIVNYNSALNLFVVDRCLARLDKNLQHDKSQLLSDCKEARKKVGYVKEGAARALKKIKERGFLSPFFLKLFLSQLYAVPAGIFLKVPSDMLISKYTTLIGASMGIPPGVLILEAIAVVSCVLMVFVPTIGPRIKCKKNYARLQYKESMLEDTIKAIKQQ